MSSGNLERFYPFTGITGANLNFIVDAIDGLRRGVITILDASGNITIDKGVLKGPLTGPITINGALTVTGAIQGNSYLSVGGANPVSGIQTGDLVVNRGGGSPGTGAIYFGSSTGAHYLYYDGTQFQLTDKLSITGDVATSGRVLFSSAASKIVPGGTSLGLRNNADNADNLLITDAGIITTRNSLGIGGTPTNSLSLITAAATQAAIDFKIGSGGTSFVGVAGASGGGVPGTVLGDLFIRTGPTQSIYFSVDGGGSAAGSFTAGNIFTSGVLKATGAASLGSAASGRYVANWTTIGAPTGLTGIVGDFGFDGNNNPWSCTAAGTPGTWVPVGIHRLQRTVTTAAQTNVDWQNIPGSYTNLRIEYSARETGSGTNIQGLFLNFNNDFSAGGYQYEIQVTSGVATAIPVEQVGTTAGQCGLVMGSAAAATRFARGVVEIPDYSTVTTSIKGWLYHAVNIHSNTTGTVRMDNGIGGWSNTAVINRITLVTGGANTFVAGCVFTLYGEP